jgi:hypothetical protein
MNGVETIQLQQQEEEDEDEDVNGDLGHASKNLITSFWLLGGWLAASWPPPPGWEEEEPLTHKSVAKAKALTSALSFFSRARVRCGRYRDEKDAKLLVDPTREYSEILRVLALFPTAKNVQQSKAQGIYRTHARTLNNNTLDCLFVCWLVVAEKRTPLRYQFPSLPLIITHFRSNSSFPTSIAATSSAATTTTTMTTTYDQEVVVVFLAVKKDKKTTTPARSTAAGIFYKIQNHTQTHREKGKLQQRKRNKGPSRLTRVGPSRKPSQRTTLHKTTTAKLSQQESSKQSKQAHNPSEFFLLFFQGNT